MNIRNKMKKIFAIIMSVMMFASLCTVSAFADTKGSITVSGEGAKQAIFTSYKVLDVTEVADEGVNYVASANFTDFFNKTEYGNYSIDKIAAIDVNDSAAKVDLQSNLKKYIADKGLAGTQLTSEGEVSKLSNLDLGYYFIVQTDSSAEGAYVPTSPILISVPYSSDNGYVYDVEVDTKLNKTNVVKKIKEDNTLVDANQKKIGDYVDYVITSPVPKYSEAIYDLSKVTYFYTDTLSAGLTYDENASFVVYGVKDGVNTELELGTNYSITVNDAAFTDAVAGATIKVNFVYSSIKDFDSIIVEYKALLNENANVGGVANPNEVKLTYSNLPGTDSQGNPYTTDTPESIVKTYTYGLGIVKVDKDDNTIPLEGVEFTVTGPDGYKKVVKTDSNGKINLVGLKAGEYVLQETATIPGYILPTGDAAKTTVTITLPTKGDGTLDYENPTYSQGTVTTIGTPNQEGPVVTITNAKGFNLPTTGGAGTWMFTIGGLVLMAGAVVVFASSRKKAK